MPNKYNDPQGNKTPDNRPITPLEQSNLDEDIQYPLERDTENSGVANGLLMGFILTAIIGLGAVAYYYSGKQPSAVPATNITPPNSSPVASISSI
jgi:hypothetical protein